MSLNVIDVNIIKKLLSDARKSYRTIAWELGISPPTVLKHVKKLEKSRVIRSYSAQLDHEKIGYDLTAVIEITAVKGKIGEVENHVSRIPNVCAKGTRNLFGPHFMQMKMWYFYAVGKFVISWRCTLGSIYNALAPKIREFQKKIEY